MSKKLKFIYVCTGGAAVCYDRLHQTRHTTHDMSCVWGWSTIISLKTGLTDAAGNTFQFAFDHGLNHLGQIVVQPFTQHRTQHILDQIF